MAIKKASRSDDRPNETVKNKLTRKISEVLPEYRIKHDPSILPLTVPGTFYEDGKPQTFRETPADRRWLETIPARRGRRISGIRASLHIHSSTHLGFSGVGMGLRRELLKIPGVLKWQTGDEEFSVIFPDALVQEVADAVSAYRKRRPNKSVPVSEK